MPDFKLDLSSGQAARIKRVLKEKHSRLGGGVNKSDDDLLQDLFLEACSNEVLRAERKIARENVAAVKEF